MAEEHLLCPAAVSHVPVIILIEPTNSERFDLLSCDFSTRSLGFFPSMGSNRIRKSRNFRCSAKYQPLIYKWVGFSPNEWRAGPQEARWGVGASVASRPDTSAPFFRPRRGRVPAAASCRLVRISHLLRAFRIPSRSSAVASSSSFPASGGWPAGAPCQEGASRLEEGGDQQGFLPLGHPAMALAHQPPSGQRHYCAGGGTKSQEWPRVSE